VYSYANVNNKTYSKQVREIQRIEGTYHLAINCGSFTFKCHEQLAGILKARDTPNIRFFNFWHILYAQADIYNHNLDQSTKYAEHIWVKKSQTVLEWDQVRLTFCIATTTWNQPQLNQTQFVHVPCTYYSKATIMSG